MAIQSKHAIVIGGSIAGLMSARVLSDSFEQVTIIERDRLPQTPTERNGTPQARHVHNLLLRGLQLMESFFPGFTDELEANGANWMNWGTETRVLSKDRWLEPIETDFKTMVASRALIEWVLRERLKGLGMVSIQERMQVTGLLTSEDGQRVTGVKLRERGGRAERSELRADFVVDASGRGSKAGAWLTEIGYPAPDETRVDADVAYATRFYKKPQHRAIPWRVMYMPAKMPYTRGGAIFEIEGDVWVASLGGFCGDHPPTDPDGWMAYCKDLPKPDMYEELLDAEPIPDTGIYGYQRTANYIRHYEKLDRLPDGFILTGDAVCAFNPVYGQGMTSAAMGAALLAELLAGAETLRGFGAVYQARYAKQIEPMWLLATGNDLQYPATVGDRPDWLTRQVQRYVDLYLEMMIGDRDLTEQFYRVMNLMALPSSLLYPARAGQVLRHWWRWRGRPGAKPVASAAKATH